LAKKASKFLQKFFCTEINTYAEEFGRNHFFTIYAAAGGPQKKQKKVHRNKQWADITKEGNHYGKEKRFL